MFFRADSLDKFRHIYMGYPAAPTLKLYFTPLHFILQSPDTGVTAQLVLERTTGRCYCTENFNPFENGAKESDLYYLEIFSLLGVVVVDTILYLGVVTDADIIGNIHQANIYEIKGIELLPYLPNTWEPENQVFEKENLSKLFTSGFYFSYYYDLTRSMQNSVPGDDVHTRADPSFYWNMELSRDLISQGIDTQWLVPIVQGFVGIERVVFQDSTIALALISRRSCDRTGTRYNCRGVDEEGNVANYVETEQVVIVGDKTFAYVQVRGSIPIYWEQTGITAQLAVTRPQEVSALAFKKHLGALLQKYAHVTLINLLNNAKAHEKTLTVEMEQIFKQIRQEFASKLAYQYYDFHFHCKGKRYQAINELIKGLQDYSTYYGFYVENSVKIEQKQKGVMRTNCLDCLDRTNVVQSYIGWAALCAMLPSVHIQTDLKLENTENFNIIKSFKHMWADNGDMLSLQYTGTASTISSITRGEKQGLSTLISKSIKSIGRFYNANLNDAAKQKSIEAVLRRRKDSTQINRIETEIFSRESDYTQYSSYRIRCITWNLGGKKVTFSSELQALVRSTADIIIFSLQEVVKLNPNNVLREGSNAKRIRSLKAVIGGILSPDEYNLVLENSLIGIVLFIYCKRNKAEKISAIETDCLKLGFGGTVGNKGSVVGRFNLEDTTVCIIACHLASGASQKELRKSQICDIQADSFVKEKLDRRHMQIFEHDSKFLCGDLNFRVELPGVLARHLVSEGDIAELLKSDQLLQAFSEGALPGYKEAPISFRPTYKFDEGTDVYDSSSKQRVPSWCDRVLYNGDVEVGAYRAFDIRISDHRPVAAEFLLKCKSYDAFKKMQLTEMLMNEIGEDRGLI